MTTPLNRDQQIELMTGAEDRHRARLARWMADETVRQAFARGSTSSYHQEDRRIARCG